jgi:hypothetical protein
LVLRQHAWCLIQGVSVGGEVLGKAGKLRQ